MCSVQPIHICMTRSIEYDDRPPRGWEYLSALSIHVAGLYLFILSITSPAGAVAKYCDVYVCVYVCLSVREDIFGTACAIFTNFCGCRLWPWAVARASSGVVAIYVMYFRFVDDIIFSIMCRMNSATKNRFLLNLLIYRKVGQNSICTLFKITFLVKWDERGERTFLWPLAFFSHYHTCIDSTMHDLLKKIKASNHCLFHLLPTRRPLHQTLRDIGHGFELPSYKYKLHKQSFLTNCLLKYF